MELHLVPVANKHVDLAAFAHELVLHAALNELDQAEEVADLAPGLLVSGIGQEERTEHTQSMLSPEVVINGGVHGEDSSESSLLDVEEVSTPFQSTLFPFLGELEIDVGCLEHLIVFYLFLFVSLGDFYDGQPRLDDSSQLFNHSLPSAQLEVQIDVVLSHLPEAVPFGLPRLVEFSLL